jgi:hypothetical protein
VEAAFSLLEPEQTAYKRANLHCIRSGFLRNTGEHEMQNLDLFFDKTRWPTKPYCSDDKTARMIRSLEYALKQPYIQANPPHLRVWSIFDIDRAGGAIAWESACLPPPSWSACNTENGHAHLVYGLTVPVLVDSPDLRQKPLKYLCAVEAAFRAKLDADSGYTGLITKNPAFPDWRVLRGPQSSFDLDELSEYVDLERFAPKRKPENVGLGRNVTLFDAARHYGYRTIRGYKAAQTQGAYVYWQKDVYDEAMSRNGDFPNPLHHREVYHVARSVAKWVWRKFDIAASDARFSKLQAAQRSKGGRVRSASYEGLRADARLMRARRMTLREIAAELDVSLSAVTEWCS